MKKTTISEWIGVWLRGLLPGFVTVLASMDARANPQGMTVVSGAAAAQQSGRTLNVTASQNAFLQWNSFNIAAGETTRFQQPSSSSIVWNQIGDQNPSSIYGSLQANGMVVLANQNGFYFGPNSFVQAAGLMVTTAPIQPTGNGGGWSLSVAPTSKPIINYGRLETSSGGSLFLISKQIENHGTLSAPEGTVGLLAGQEVLISERPDGLGLSAKVRLPQGSVDNQGRIVADAGHVLMQAQTVNQGGAIQANSIREKNGVIELFASETVNLEAGSTIVAHGDSSGNSAGGQITIKSDDRFTDSAASTISAVGGGEGGNGGTIEISAARMTAIESTVEAKAAPGFKSGALVIDPTDIVLSYDGAGVVPPGGTVNQGDGSGALLLNVNNAFSGFSSITLQATHDITLNSYVSWDLAGTTRKDEAGSLLTLKAGNNVNLANGSSIYGSGNWAVTLSAGNDITLAAATLQTAKGDIRMDAGRNLSLTTVSAVSGAVRTTGGGNISASAATGSVDCGSAASTSLGSMPGGFVFSRSGYTVSPNLGGISTAAGGDVDISAGLDIKAYLPPRYVKDGGGDPGTGAFGAEPGDVTLTAGRNITGHYVVRNGDGKINAGVDAGIPSGTMLALSLVKGSWSVDAADTINLQEVRNPNGCFNYLAATSTTPAPYKYLYDYDANASVALKAGNEVFLKGANLPHQPSYPIFPPNLSVEAGKGGVEVDNDLVLFPSSVGNLSIKTTDGGNLFTQDTATFHSITVSDSDNTHWNNSSSVQVLNENDHGAKLLHLGDSQPVVINVSGSISDLTFYSPKPLEISAGKDILGASFTAINFKPTDRTTVTAGGVISYRSDYAFVILPSAPQMNLLFQYQNPPTQNDLIIQGLLNSIRYDAVRSTLWFHHKMTLEQLKALNNIHFADAQSLQTLYDLSLNTPDQPTLGMMVLGPGLFKISASSINLGSINGVISKGIDTSSTGLSAKVAGDLGTLIARGADIDIDVPNGELTMLSTTIESEYGGNILINCGTLNVGTGANLGAGSAPRGIITLWKGNITVKSKGNVELNGSRIATYDGGNIDITSSGIVGADGKIKDGSGNVDAGQGGMGFIQVKKPYIDPITKQLGIDDAFLGGSGILALSYPTATPGQPLPNMGNITVTTPHGDISASMGGIVQIPYGPVSTKYAKITLTAGSIDADKTVHIGNISAAKSGVVGGDIVMNATGDIDGLVVGQNIAITSEHNVNVTAIAQGNASVTAAGTVGGTVAGAGTVNVTGAEIGAVLAGGTVNAVGNLGGAAAPAPAPTSNAEGAQSANKIANETSDDTDDLKKRKGRPAISEYVGRVTVILPKS